MEQLSYKKRVRDESDEPELDLPDVKRLRDDLLSSLDDTDPGSTSPGLDSFLKSLEEEISASPPVTVVDLTSDAGDSQPELGFLLEASDDELGLPPSTNTSSDQDVVELVQVSPDSTEFSAMWRFEDQILGYDSFELGFAGGQDNYNGNDNGEYVSLDGLFDYSDLGLGFYDAPELLRRSETTPEQ